MNCDRCNASTHNYDLMDFCAVCSKNLCPACMAKGCCGNVPAKSGEELDADTNTTESEELAKQQDNQPHSA